jgi:hypothetical protein
VAPGDGGRERPRGSFSYFVSADMLRNDVGIESRDGSCASVETRVS